MKPQGNVVEDLRNGKFTVYINELEKFMSIYQATATLEWSAAYGFRIIVSAAVETLPTSFCGVTVVDNT